MQAQERFPGHRIARVGTGVSAEQIVDKNRIVRESLIGIKIQAKINIRTTTDDGSEVALEIGAAKDLGRFAAESFELGGLLAPEIVAREFVIPGTVRKTRHGAAIDFFLLCAKTILLQKDGQAFVQTGVVGVVVDFAAENR